MSNHTGGIQNDLLSRRSLARDSIVFFTQVEVIDPNLRRHQLVQQGAEEVGEGGVLSLMGMHFTVDTRNSYGNLPLLINFFGKWY
jgi:hypothetical protein